MRNWGQIKAEHDQEVHEQHPAQVNARAMMDDEYIVYIGILEMLDLRESHVPKVDLHKDEVENLIVFS